MKYCINSPTSKYLDKADEISMTIKSIKKLDLKKTIDLFLKYKDKKINLYIEDNEDFIKNHGMPTFAAIKETYPELQLSIVLSKPDFNELNDKLLELIKKSNFPYYYTTYVSDWETLHFYKNLGVSEMYICGELGFELDNVGPLLHKAGIKVRVIPNVAQCKEFLNNNITAFYIRPEDIPYYEKYVDTLDFYCTTGQEADALYKVYAIDKKWTGKLSTLILWLEGELEGKYITPVFGSRRVKCGHKCLKGKMCSVCETTEQLCITMNKTHSD